jgi:hypothetical protein
MGKKYSKAWGTLAGFLAGGIIAAAAQHGLELENDMVLQGIIGLFALIGVVASPANS